MGYDEVKKFSSVGRSNSIKSYGEYNKILTTGLNSRVSGNMPISKKGGGNNILSTVANLGIGIVKGMVSAPYYFGQDIENLRAAKSVSKYVSESELRSQSLQKRSLDILTSKYKSGKISKEEYRKGLLRINTPSSGINALNEMTPTKEQIIGHGLETALNVAMAGAPAFRGVEVLGSVGKGVKAFASGTVTGGAYGTTSAMGENKNLEDVLMSAGTGMVMGGVLGGIASRGATKKGLKESLTKKPVYQPSVGAKDGITLYHGGTKIDKVGNMRGNWDAFYMSDNPEYAKSYGGKNSVLNKMTLSKDAKMADLRKPDESLISQIEKIISPKETGKTVKITRPDGSILEIPEKVGGLQNPVHSSSDIIQGIRDGKAYYAEMPEVKQALKKLGYDGMITKESKFGSNYGVWNKNVVQPSIGAKVVKGSETSAIEKITTQLKLAKSKLGARAAENKALREAQAKGYEGLLKEYKAKGKTGQEAHDLAVKALEKTAERENSLVPRLNIPKAELDTLYEKLDKELPVFSKGTKTERAKSVIVAKNALKKLTEGDFGLAPHEIRVLSKGLGINLGRLMPKPTTLTGITGRAILDTGNLMRAGMSTGDLSVLLRQTFTAVSRNPVMGAKAFAKGLKYWGTGRGKEEFESALSKIKDHPNWRWMKESGLEIQGMGGSEMYPSNALEKVKGVKNIVQASERNFIGVGNDIRAERFNRFVEQYAKKGKTPANDPELFKGLAAEINASTGIGKIPERLEHMSETLNATLFSPRLLFSRFHYLNPKTYLPTELIGLNKELQVAKKAGNEVMAKQIEQKIFNVKEIKGQAAKDMAAMVSVSVGALLTAKAMGAEVETDPRSSDFGKAKFGNTRFEITGGFTPYLRNLVQFATGQTKSTTTGKITSLDSYGGGGRSGVAIKFARSKLNPLAGTVWNIADRKNMVGQPTTLKSIFVNSTPMVWQDTWSAMTDEERSNFKTIMVATGGILGVGTNTYGSPINKEQMKAQDKYAKKKKSFGETLKFRATGQVPKK